jgi:hypothetical protein
LPQIGASGPGDSDSGRGQVPGDCRVIAYSTAAMVVPEEISPRPTMAGTSARSIHSIRLDS